jgi:hypothetical protein
MGQNAALLLVMLKRLSGALLLALCLLPGCHRQPSADGAPVDASSYDAFYLWPGVHPAESVRPRTLYLLDGEVRRGGAARLERLRMGTPHLPGQAVWLVVRADRLDWNAATYAAILADLASWRKAGNRVVGLQVDFDAATKGITGYAAFLRDLRRRLPGENQLSVTGLMDWSAHGDPQALASLAGTVDEVVMQTYQGRSTIPGYEDYFRKMGHFPIPFRVALVEHGTWAPPPELAQHPKFRGYVVFLLKPSAW